MLFEVWSTNTILALRVSPIASDALHSSPLKGRGREEMSMDRYNRPRKLTTRLF
jgi:hypothetical protein